LKILFISYQLPYPLDSGAKIRCYELLKHYSKRHEVSLICFIKRPKETRFLSLLKKVCFNVYPISRETIMQFNQSEVKFLRIVSKLFSITPFIVKLHKSIEMIQTLNDIDVNNYDVLHIQEIFMLPNIINFIRNKRSRPYIIFDVGDIQSRKLFRLIRITNLVSKIGFENILEYFKLIIYEKRFFPLFDCRFVCSKNDRDFLLARGCTSRIEVIPNGADLAKYNYEKCSKSLSGKLILFLGSMMYEPNEDAVLFFIKSIFPV
jgi:polysaccharide biosynthesis protein PslH